MTVLVELTAPAESVAMAATLTAAPETVVEVERVVGHPAATLTPYFWTHGGDDEAFEDALSTDPTVETYERLDAYGEETLYRSKWDADNDGVPSVALEHDATVLEAAGQDGEWELKLRFPADDGVASFSRGCSRRDFSYDVDRIYHPKQPAANGGSGLTRKQREAVQAALAAGYYEVPPEATMAEVAGDVGVSQQSVSRRLRRAHRNLVTDALTVPTPSSNP